MNARYNHNEGASYAYLKIAEDMMIEAYETQTGRRPKMSRTELLWIRNLISDDRDTWYDAFRQEEDEDERKNILLSIERAQNVICQVDKMIQEIDNSHQSRKR